jgi:hypothetical protein
MLSDCRGCRSYKENVVPLLKFETLNLGKNGNHVIEA